MPCLNPSQITEAYILLKKYINHTPLIQSTKLNKLFNCNIFFKIEALQKTGSFKIRGILHHLLKLKKNNNCPQKIVTYSTGNHGIALAYSSELLGLNARIYLPKNTNIIKGKIAVSYGAEVIYTNTRQEAEERAKKDEELGFYFVHPSDNNDIILGAGTACYEALLCNRKFDAIFASCGGGGLLSGSYLAKEYLSPSTLLIGCEPQKANDAFLSRKSGNIYRFNETPNTIADGLRALSISPRSFEYIKKLDDFLIASEEEIINWTVWLTHLLKITCETSAALPAACAAQLLKKNVKFNNILIIISGGNIDPGFYQNFQYILDKNPSIF